MESVRELGITDSQFLSFREIKNVTSLNIKNIDIKNCLRFMKCNKQIDTFKFINNHLDLDFFSLFLIFNKNIKHLDISELVLNPHILSNILTSGQHLETLKLAKELIVYDQSMELLNSIKALKRILKVI